MTTVYRPTCTSEFTGRWSKCNTRPSRNISTVIFDRKKKDELLTDINEYLHPRTHLWYSDHGISYRRGYLFSGAPGMGKTSLTSALAGLFGLNIYVLSLLDPHLNESKLMKLMSDIIPSRCIVLLEDVDAAGLGRRNLRGEEIKTAADSLKLGAADFSATQLYTPPPSGAQTPIRTISLSGLLNAIDGVSAQEGRILIMTTNSPESLDAALMRELFINMYSDLSIDVSEQTKDPAPSLDAMADTFASSIPERSVSLARLQGYLLQYKQCPQEASGDILEVYNSETSFKTFGFIQHYSLTKLFLIVYVIVVGTGPTQSGLERDFQQQSSLGVRVAVNTMNLMMQTSEQGARTYISGLMLGEQGHAQFGQWDSLNRPAKWCSDPNAIMRSERVWASVLTAVERDFSGAEKLVARVRDGVSSQ
ncbi:P-loop containing nucleoside triphosphate hydrolase protein [Aspergillus caelatus]|uniref:P-loop containing nucleoside triphosphate hydrolase protein n=1 Tax=Aspergillus caelatus TaxID=61420 RepID=A0A5N6ZKY2_9EURO|nr:P-loop containing nucleoside triphosphate hydrolase protein [Aspergillus caelatus]KAE8358038.1 P-loop containing nucleoside triphosphate hydrolase protein [Aspergillus caelatus]